MLGTRMEEFLVGGGGINFFGPVILGYQIVLLIHDGLSHCLITLSAL